jgi:hypothetical protein
MFALFPKIKCILNFLIGDVFGRIFAISEARKECPRFFNVIGLD